MADYTTANVLCPFFKRYMRKKQMISCEGIPRSASSNLMFFETAHKADRYVTERCSGEYQTCPVARSIMEKYQ